MSDQTYWYPSQTEGHSLVYWNDRDRPTLEIETPYSTTVDPKTIVFLCFDSAEDLAEELEDLEDIERVSKASKRFIIPLDAVSYIETNFG